MHHERRIVVTKKLANTKQLRLLLLFNFLLLLTWTIECCNAMAFTASWLAQAVANSEACSKCAMWLEWHKNHLEPMSFNLMHVVNACWNLSWMNAFMRGHAWPCVWNRMHEATICMKEKKGHCEERVACHPHMHAHSAQHAMKWFQTLTGLQKPYCPLKTTMPGRPFGRRSGTSPLVGSLGW